MKKTSQSRSENLVHQEVCANCGKKLPVEIVRCSDTALVGVFCKHCKTITMITIER